MSTLEVLGIVAAFVFVVGILKVLVRHAVRRLAKWWERFCVKRNLCNACGRTAQWSWRRAGEREPNGRLCDEHLRVYVPREELRDWLVGRSRVQWLGENNGG